MEKVDWMNPVFVPPQRSSQSLLLGRVDCISSGKTVATTITTLIPSARARPEVGMSPRCPLLGFLCVASSS